MNYRYRVTLSGIKGFYRVYIVNGDNSLYTFHKQLRSDLEFPMDQPILFKALDGEGGVVARYALMDIGYGAVDNVTIADTIKAGVASFVYFYDIASKAAHRGDEGAHTPRIRKRLRRFRGSAGRAPAPAGRGPRVG